MSHALTAPLLQHCQMVARLQKSDKRGHAANRDISCAYTHNVIKESCGKLHDSRSHQHVCVSPQLPKHRAQGQMAASKIVPTQMASYHPPSPPTPLSASAMLPEQQHVVHCGTIQLPSQLPGQALVLLSEWHLTRLPEQAFPQLAWYARYQQDS